MTKIRLPRYGRNLSACFVVFKPDGFFTPFAIHSSDTRLSLSLMQHSLKPSFLRKLVKV